MRTKDVFLSGFKHKKTAKTDPVKTLWLCKLAEYWQELEQAVIHKDQEHSKHAHWVTSLVGMLAIHELG